VSYLCQLFKFNALGDWFGSGWWTSHLAIQAFLPENLCNRSLKSESPQLTLSRHEFRLWNGDWAKKGFTCCLKTTGKVG
jgi:hypothetical protein